MNKPLITVVVPCYNSEKRINNVITSLINQTYPADKLQIIMVDDLSKDNTKALLEETAKTHINFECYSCRTKGVSEARNTGIEKARGEYITFIDSDDIVSPYHIENLYNVLSSSNAQLAVTNYKKVSNNTKYSKLRFSKVKNKLSYYNRVECAKRFLSQNIEFCIWNKLYITKIIHDNNIWFNKDCRYNEDSYFNYQYIKKIDKAVCSSASTYYYVQSKNSLVREKFKESRLDMYLSLNAIVSDAYNNFTEVKEYSHSIRVLMGCELIFWIFKSDYANPLVINKVLEYFIEDVKHLKKCKLVKKYRRLLIPLIPPLAKLIFKKRLKGKKNNSEYTLPAVLN